MPLGQALGHLGRGWILQKYVSRCLQEEGVGKNHSAACMRACVYGGLARLLLGNGKPCGDFHSPTRQQS